ncbi:DUF3560 domain-containing protein [Streptomyces sp. NPDC020801]|uniref:DUF3560 domain-containing protein n=1 Tax=Streptomyces sp. NPDC020801 TaxID=3365093 RepID=UPI0037A76965
MAFRWGYDMQAWYLRNSRDGDADMWTVRKLRGYLEEAGYTVAVVIDNDAERAYADAVQEQYDRAGDRAERYSGYAANASARSEGAWKASHAIADHMTGEPIKLGHHSERRHRRDIERMDSHMRRSIQEEKKAAYHASRAISAEHFEEFKKNPARTLRRLDGPEGLRKQLRDVDKWAAGNSACGYTRSTTAEGLETLARERRRIVEKIAYWEEVIAEAERQGFKVWGKADFERGDFVHTGGTWREVLRVNAKSVTVPHILTRTGVAVVRSEDRTCTAGTVYYGRPSPCKGGKRCTCDTGTIGYDAVSGWASAADIARLEATKAEPEAERKTCPHCKRVANGEKRFSMARGMCTVCGYARPQNFKPKPVPDVVEGQAEEEPTEVADTAEISGEGSPAQGGQGFEAADDPAQIDELPETAPERLARPAAPASVAVPELEAADDPAQIDDMPAPAPECGPRAFGDMVAVFVASQGGSPARQRVLWWMPRRDGQAVCSDARTSGARFMLCWTAEPGEHGTDWDFVTDDGRFGEVLRDVHARPLTAEGYAERRPGTCHPERWCGHAWPCGRDAEAWKARQPKRRLQLLRERQAEARAAKKGRLAAVSESGAEASARELPLADVVSDPSSVEVMDTEGGAPVEAPRTDIERSVARFLDERRAADTVPGLGWSPAMADVVGYAAAGELHADGVGGFRRGEDVGTRRVDRERVRLLIGAGFLKAPERALPGPVECTADGREALQLVALNPAGLLPEGEAMGAVRHAKRANQWMSRERQEANALTPLPGGEEVARRRAEAARRMEEWEREAAERRARTGAILARAEEEEAEERRQAEARRAAEAAPCVNCAGVYPVEARCGECRDRAAAGLPLVDAPRDVVDEQIRERRALPASPVRKALEAGERKPIVTPYTGPSRVFEVEPMESSEVLQVRALAARLRAADDVEVVAEPAARNWFEPAVVPAAVVEDREDEHQDQGAPALSWDEIADELRQLWAELNGDDQEPEDGPSLTWGEVMQELAALRGEISPARPVALPVWSVRNPQRLRREALSIAASAALVTVAAGQVAEVMPRRW